MHFENKLIFVILVKLLWEIKILFDTFRLNLSDETLIDVNKAKIKIIDFPKEAGENLTEKYDLFHDQDGVLYTGDKGYLNHELFNFSIFKGFKKEYESEGKNLRVVGYDNNYKKFSIPVKTKIDEKFNSKFFLQFSLPKIYAHKKNNNTYNLKSLNDNQIIESFNYLDSILKENGITTRLDEAYLSRVDLFNNVTTKRKFETYDFLFKNLFLSRKENFIYDSKTYLFKNKQNQVCIYDKVNELKQIHKIDLTGNITRFENRFMNKKKILKIFGNTLKAGGILHNKKEYKKEMINLGNTIFKKDYFEANKMNIENIKEIISRYKKTEGRNWWGRFKSDFALLSLHQYLNVDEIQEIVCDHADNRMGAQRIRKEFKETRLKNQIKTKKRVDLYNELKDQYFLNLN